MSRQPVYVGDGTPRDVRLGPPPPWRDFPRQDLHGKFKPPHGLVQAVNAALALRRPLLVTGPAGSGKSSVIEQVAAELRLGTVLRWHITSRSALTDALYRYDALGRIHAQRLADAADDIVPFLQLGPLGTALIARAESGQEASGLPRALLIDEIDKSDLDLPSDLLDVLERGEFEIPELARFGTETVAVREWAGEAKREIHRGRVQCAQFPFIVMTSNGERDFPAAFLRRCVRFTMPVPDSKSLGEIVAAHLGTDTARTDGAQELIEEFVLKLAAGESLAIDQLLNAVHLLTGEGAPEGEARRELKDLLLRELSRA